MRSRHRQPYTVVTLPGMRSVATRVVEQRLVASITCVGVDGRRLLPRPGSVQRVRVEGPWLRAQRDELLIWGESSPVLSEVQRLQQLTFHPALLLVLLVEHSRREVQTLRPRREPEGLHGVHLIVVPRPFKHLLRCAERHEVLRYKPPRPPVILRARIHSHQPPITAAVQVVVPYREIERTIVLPDVVQARQVSLAAVLLRLVLQGPRPVQAVGREGGAEALAWRPLGAVHGVCRSRAAAPVRRDVVPEGAQRLVAARGVGLVGVVENAGAGSCLGHHQDIRGRNVGRVRAVPRVGDPFVVLGEGDAVRGLGVHQRGHRLAQLGGPRDEALGSELPVPGRVAAGAARAWLVATLLVAGARREAIVPEAEGAGGVVVAGGDVGVVPAHVPQPVLHKQRIVRVLRDGADSGGEASRGGGRGVDQPRVREQPDEAGGRGLVHSGRGGHQQQRWEQPCWDHVGLAGCDTTKLSEIRCGSQRLYFLDSGPLIQLKHV